MFQQLYRSSILLLLLFVIFFAFFPLTAIGDTSSIVPIDTTLSPIAYKYMWNTSPSHPPYLIPKDDGYGYWLLLMFLFVIFICFKYSKNS